MNKLFKKIIIVLLVVIILGTTLLIINNKSELRSIKNDKQFMRIYNHDNGDISLIKRILTFPFSCFWNGGYSYDGPSWEYTDTVKGNLNTYDSDVKSNSTNNDDYSKTNIQVEGVDEADIVKTDGKYIYSISSEKVIITDASNPSDIKIVSTIYSDGSNIPIDLILYNNYLTIIYYKSVDYYGSSSNTVVDIYDLTNISSPKKEKNFELYEGYYTTRCIDGKLYVISSGILRTNNDHVIREYKEDNNTYDIPFKDIKYLKNYYSKYQTLIAEVNLKDIHKEKIKLSSYLVNISNSYVSENNIYLLDEFYDDEIAISSIFGIKGFFGLFDSNSSIRKTLIYKFSIDKDKGVTYKTKNDVEGYTINQYSLDEYNNHLRLALGSDQGTRVMVLDEKLNVIGETEKVASGERMYSSRFMNNKAYLVTYKNTDPLFVIDLEDEKNPKILGELHIPGYSTYLHPYDDNHIIGIGMDTSENISRDEFGNVISSGSVVTGMKMSLFDVSDVNNPKQLSTVKIGDRRCVSAVLTNPKALLFSKDKNLIAIPVNNYDEDFSVNSSTSYDDAIYFYNNHDKKYISEGYLVYNIDLNEGFKLKGVITHDKKLNYKNIYNYGSKLLRGLYIKNNLFTVSEDAIKVNNLDTLEEISKILIGEKE